MGAAIAAALIGVAGTVGTAAYTSSQTKKAAGAVGQQNLQQYSPYTIPYGQISQVNPTAAASESTNTNAGLFNQNAQLAQRTNAFNYQNALHYYQNLQPYFSQLQSQLGQNALQASQGQLPSDVQSNIQRMAASQGIAGGFGYGQNASQGGVGNLNLRNLGLTSLQQQQYGNQLGMQINSQAKALSPNMMSPSDEFISPTTYLGAQEFNSGQINQTNLTNAGYLNQASAVNAGAYNALQQNVTQAGLAGSLASAQILGQAGQQAGSLLSKYASNQSGSSGGLFGNYNTGNQTSSTSLYGTLSPSQISNSTGSTAFDPNA